MRRSMMCVGALALLGLSGVAQGVVVLGNYPPTNDTGTTADVDNLRHKAISFNMPAGDGYTISSITMRLQNYITPADVAVLQIRGAGPDPLTPGATVVGNFLAPASAAAAVGDFVFTPIGTVTLDPSTTYWIYLSGADAVTSFDWRGSSPSVTPTGIATYGGASRFTTNAGTTWTTSATINTFQIDGELIPAPASALLLALGGLVGSRRRR